MNEIKTFPLKFTKEFHEILRDAASKTNKTLYQFIQEAIEEKLKENK